MKLRFRGSLTKELPTDLSDEYRATKKVHNRVVELDDKAHGLSFRDTLIGNSKHNEDGLFNEAANFVIEDPDVKLFHDGGVPAIVFSDRAQKLMADLMKNAVVVKLLGKSIGYRTLWTRIHALWNPLGEIKIVNLDNNYFIVKLNSYKDYLNALMGGPWVVLGHYLTVKS